MEFYLKGKDKNPEDVLTVLTWLRVEMVSALLKNNVNHAMEEQAYGLVVLVLSGHELELEG